MARLERDAPPVNGDGIHSMADGQHTPTGVQTRIKTHQKIYPPGQAEAGWEGFVGGAEG